MSEESFFAHIQNETDAKPEQKKVTESPDDRFFSYLEEESSESLQASQNISAVRDIDPDTEAQHYDLSKKTGIPLSIVRNAPEQVKEIDGMPVYTIQDPSLIQKYLGKSHNNAAISKDDIPGLEKVQKKLDDVPMNFFEAAFEESSKPFVNIEKGGTIERLLTERPTIKGVAKAVGAGIALGATSIPRAFSDLIDFVEPLIVDKRKLDFRDKNFEKIHLSEDLQGWLRDKIGETKAEELIASSFESVGMMGSLFLTGGEGAVLPGMAAISGLSKTDEALRKGAPRSKAVIAGATQAATEYLTEKIPLDILRAPATSFIKKFLQEAAFDIPGELVSTATEMWLIDQKILGGEHKSKDEYKQALLDTLFVSIITSGTLSTTTHGLQLATDRAEKEIARQTKKNQQNQAFHNILSETFDVVQEAKTTQRSPDHAKEFIRELPKGQKEIYISPEGIDTFFQEHTDEEVNEILKKLAVSPEKARETIATGEDTAIQISDMLTLKPEEYDTLKDYIKPAPGAYTQREIQEQKANEDIENSINLLKEETEKSKQVDAEINRLQSEVQKAKLPDPKLAEDAPVLLKGLANRLSLEGIDPAEFLKKIEIKKERFAVAKDLIERGKQFLQSAFHGTPFRFDKFSLEHLGKGEGAQAFGWGLYFAEKKDIADWYRSNLTGREEVPISNVSIGEFKIIENEKALVPEDRPKEGLKLYHDSPQTQVASELAREIDNAKNIITGAFNRKGSFGAQIQISYLLDRGARKWRTIEKGNLEILSTSQDITKEEAKIYAGDVAKQYEQLLKNIKQLDYNVRKLKKGATLKVELPGDEQILNYSTPLTEQPDNVKKIINEAIKDNPEAVDKSTRAAINRGDDKFMTGGDLYDAMAAHIGSEKAASQWLSEHGIKGHKFWDGSSRNRAGDKTFNFVIYDDEVIDIVETFFQAEKAGPPTGRPTTPRGAVTITDEKTLIQLFEGADMSTVLHEVGHIALLEYSNLERSGQASTLLKQDMGIIRKWVGAEQGADLTRDQSEQFARGFEAYLMEGKAPNPELRTAFERFKQWLIQTYKTVKSLNVKLDRNVRGVFDRMLSANIEVEAAAAQNGFTIKTTDEMNALGIRKEDQVYAKNLIDIATKKAERKLTQARNKNYRENLIKWKEEARREIRRENPIYNTINEIINDGRQLDRDDFINAGQAEITDLPTRKLIKKDGANIDMVAAFYGFDDAQAMINEFVNTQKFSEAVNQRVNEKQIAHDAQWRAEDFLVDLKEYRDYLDLIARYVNSQTIDQATIEKSINTNIPRWRKEAQAEISNEAPDLTGDALEEAINTRVEEKTNAFRVRKAKPSAITTASLKRLAKETMNAKTVRDAQRVDKFLAAAKKAASDGRRAILRKDWGEASRSSEIERFNYEMAGLAVKIRNEVTAAQEYAKKVGKPKKTETIDFEHKEAILHLVSRYNLASLAPREPQNFPDYTSLFAGDDFGNQGFPDPEFLKNGGINDFRDLRIEQLRELDNAIHYLAGKGRIEKSEFLTDSEVSFEEVNNDTLSKVNKLKPLKKWEKGSMMRRLSDATRSFFARLDSLTFIAKSIDGYTNLGKDGVKGPMELYVIDKIKRKMNEGDIRKGEITAQFEPHLKRIQNTNRAWRKRFGSHINIEGVPLPQRLINDGQTKGWKDYQIWGAILNTGNIGEKSNMENLLAGYPDLTPGMVEKMKSLLSIKDMQAIQGIWDTIDTLFKDADAQFLKDNNYHMPKVEATPFIFKGETFRGGYYPISHDKNLSYKVADRGQIEDFFTQEAGKISVPYTKKNFTIQRQSGVALPVRLDLSGIDKHIRDTLNYIYLSDVIRDADKITRNEEFRDAVTRVLGKDVYDAIRPALQHIANPVKEGLDQPGSQLIERMRGLATLYNLAWNTGVAIKQPLSTYGAIRDMGFIPYLKGMGSVLGSPSAHYQQMTELSIYMKERMSSFDRELRSQFLKLTAEQKGIYFGDSKITWEDVKYFGFWQIRLADTVTVLPIWHGAFQDKLLADQSNLQEAIEYADDIVRNSQPSAQPLDLSSWQRDGGAIRLLSMFQTFTVGKYGQRQRLFYRAWKNGAITTQQYAWFNFMDGIAPLIAINMIQSLLWGRDFDEETREEIVKNVLAGWAAMGIPIAGNIARSMSTGYGDAFDSPILETGNKLINDGFKGIKGMATFKNKKEREKALWSIAHVTSILSGVPLDKVVAKAQKGAKQKKGVPVIKYLVPAPKKRR